MNDAYLQTLGRIVRAQREAQGLSVTKFALMIGISRPTVYRIEGGKGNFLFSAVVKVADGLGMTISELFLLCDQILHNEDPTWELPTIPGKDGRHYAHISVPHPKPPK